MLAQKKESTRISLSWCSVCMEEGELEVGDIILKVTQDGEEKNLWILLECD